MVKCWDERKMTPKTLEELGLKVFNMEGTSLKLGYTWTYVILNM